MQTATLSTLPPEVLDLIFSFVDEEDSRSSAEQNAFRRFQDYYALSQTSRSLYTATRNRLYTDPLSSGTRSWKRANKLLASLEANENALGRLVRSLRTLPDWVASLSTTTPETTSHSFQRVGQTKAFSWMVAMISVCPKLRQVGVTFATLPQTTLLSSALKPSFSTLNTVTLQKTPSFQTQMDLVNTFLAKLEVGELELLECRGIGWRSKGKNRGTFSSPQTPFVVRGLKIFRPSNLRSYEYTGEDYHRQFLPTQLAHLTSLVIECHSFSVWRARLLFDLTAPYLKKLVIHPLNECWSGWLSEYGIQRASWTIATVYASPTLPLETFALFPHLEHLELHNMRTLSVARLAALAESSPSLLSLLCPDSLWLVDSAEPSRAIAGWNTTLFPQNQLVGIFKTFSKLKQVDLGILPFEEEADIFDLSDFFEDKAELKFKLCETQQWCGNCGGYH
ncbi:hypothetical protein JCM6882_003955 [Rhodosporidiobolus microsporus]